MIGLGLIALLALAILLLAQAPGTSLPTIERSAPSNDAASAPSVDPLASAHPADRKFFSGQYVGRTSSIADAYYWAGVHPADRRFFGAPYVMPGAPGASVQAAAEAADRKFGNAPYTGGAAIDLHPADRKFEYMVTDPLDGVHPADRKFFADR
jgi:hypothetical protein